MISAVPEAAFQYGIQPEISKGRDHTAAEAGEGKLVINNRNAPAINAERDTDDVLFIYIQTRLIN